MRAIVLLAVLACASVTVLPTAASEHCTLGMRAAAKSSLTPVPAPPYLNNTRLGCIEGSHEFFATDDQIFVRCHCPFNSARPT